ncbi:hypothetical protein MMC30_007259 [Trapelia coarctata]|nr:hypothetical protein [Trapelia coarctata]
MPPPKPVELHWGPYTIHQSAAKPVPFERYPRLFAASQVTALGLWLLYIGARFRFARAGQNDTPTFMWRVWVTLFAEIYLSLLDVLTTLGLLFPLFSKALHRSRYRLIGSSAPTIDVALKCCGEPLDVIINSVAAIAAQDYPSNRFRIFILDDGHDKRLQEAVEAFGEKEAQGPQVSYRSRVLAPGTRSYFKAGNLHFGLDEGERLGASECFAALDGNMIPEPDWLRKLIPHLILEDKLALACPPEAYYNVPNFDPLGQQADFAIGFTLYEPLNDRLNEAMCIGSGYIVRKAALADIGGWPLVDAGEDYMCSALLSNAGWKLAYIDEYLQLGLAPESLRVHVKQQIRWIDSGLSVHRRFGFYIPDIVKATWGQRVLPTAMLPMHSDGPMSTMWTKEQRYCLRRIFLIAYLTHKIKTHIVYRHVGLRALENLQSNAIWGVPFGAYRCLVSLLPNTTYSFQPSGSILSAANERSRNRNSLPYRLLSFNMMVYALYIVFASAPLFLGLLAYRSGSLVGSLFPFPGVVIKFLECIRWMAVPLIYMTFPPTSPEWHELLETDAQGVKRPKKKADILPDDTRLIWVDVVEILVIYLCDWR